MEKLSKIFKKKETVTDKSSIEKKQTASNGDEVLKSLLAEIKKIPKVTSVVASPPKSKTYEEQGIKIGDKLKEGKGKLNVKLIYKGRIK